MMNSDRRGGKQMKDREIQLEMAEMLGELIEHGQQC